MASKNKPKWENIKRPWEAITGVWELMDTFFDIFSRKKPEEYKNVYDNLDDEKKKKVV